jgi:elongation factor Ts
MGRGSAQGRLAARVAEDGHRGSMIGLVCESESVADSDELNTFARALAAHAMDPSLVERAREIASGGLAEEPAELKERLIATRMHKFFAENTLVGQPWIHDDRASVATALVAQLGAGSRVQAFRRFHVGQ